MRVRAMRESAPPTNPTPGGVFDEVIEVDEVVEVSGRWKGIYVVLRRRGSRRFEVWGPRGEQRKVNKRSVSAQTH